MDPRPIARNTAREMLREREFELFVRDSEAALHGKPLPLCADHHAIEQREVTKFRRCRLWNPA